MGKRFIGDIGEKAFHLADLDARSDRNPIRVPIEARPVDRLRDVVVVAIALRPLRIVGEGNAALVVEKPQEVAGLLGPQGRDDDSGRQAHRVGLRRSGFSAEVGQRITVRYENIIAGDFIADLIVGDVLLCELKAISSLSKADEVQMVNYLTATNRDFGLLLNFGSQSLQFKRKYRRSGSASVIPTGGPAHDCT